jgi:hypothetical protein
MNKIIIAFCEGQHDISFLSRILFVDGFVAQFGEYNAD